MSIIVWVIAGILTGTVVSFFVDPEEQGLITTIALGVLGAVLGGLLMSFFISQRIDEVNILGVIFAIFSAWIVIKIGSNLKPTDMY